MSHPLTSMRKRSGGGQNVGDGEMARSVVRLWYCGLGVVLHVARCFGSVRWRPI